MGFRFIALPAERTATIREGKELEAPTAIVSPLSIFASFRRNTMRAAKLGLVVVLLASRLPMDVVIRENSRPMSPVWFRSMFLSRIGPFSPRHSLITSTASAIISEALIISPLSLSPSLEGKDLASTKNRILKAKRTRITP